MILNKHHLKFVTLSIMSFFLSHSAFANDQFCLSTGLCFNHIRPVFTLQGGIAYLGLDHSQQYTGTDDDLFIYAPHHSHLTTGTFGGFLGIETIPNYNSFAALQLGIEYNYFDRITIKGVNNVGVEPATMTPYDYRYREQTQQILAAAKILAIGYRAYHPYVLVGLGAAINQSRDYSATTQQTGSINITPTFSNNTETSFSYAVGLGLDFDVNENVRVGLGYRFTDLGKSAFHKGLVTFNDYQNEVPFGLGNNHIYANEILVNISYLAS